MIKNFKLGVRLLKYCFGIKTNAALALMFIAAGTLSLFFIPGNSVWVFYWVMAPIYIVQILSSLNVTALVNSAPGRKALYTSIPVLLCLPLQLLLYGVGSMMELLMLHMGKVQEQDVVYGMIVSGGLMLIFMVYVGGAFKCFVVSVVVMCVGTPTLLFRGYGILRTLRPNISLGAAIVTGLAEILLGSCLQYLLSLLIYRQPVSKAAQMRQLQKYM